METIANSSVTPPAEKRLGRECAMIAASLGLTLVVALVAFELQQWGVAPAVIFPLLVGVAVGGCLLLVERQLNTQIVNTRIGRYGWVLAAVCGLAAVVDQEAIGYFKVQRPQEAARLSDPRLELFRDEGFTPQPTSFAQYFNSHVQAQPLWWTLDLLLTVAGSVSVVVYSGRSAIRPSDPSAAASSPSA